MREQVTGAAKTKTRELYSYKERGCANGKQSKGDTSPFDERSI